MNEECEVVVIGLLAVVTVVCTESTFHRAAWLYERPTCANYRPTWGDAIHMVRSAKKMWGRSPKDLCDFMKSL